MTGSWRVLDAARAGRAPRARPGSAAPRRARGRPVQRPGARADDRVAHPLRPAARRSSGPDILAPEFDEARFLRRLREDDPTRPIGDAAARPAHDRRDRQHVEGGGLLRGRHRPVAAGRRGRATTRPARSSTAPARACSASARDGNQTPLPAHLRQGRAARARAAAARDPAARARATTTARPSGARRVRRDRRAASATRAPTTSRRATRAASFDAALAARVDMIEFDVLPRGPGRPRREPAAARARLRAPRPPDALTLEEGLAHLADGRVRRRRARRRPQAARLRGARGRGAARARAASSGRSSPRCSCAASSRCASWSRGCGSAGRCRA